MKFSYARATGKQFTALLLLCTPLWLVHIGAAQTSQAVPPVVLTARVEKGKIIYNLNGRRVEDSKPNSLLTNLSRVVEQRGTEVPVFIVIDVRASFSEVGKLETALDKADLTHRRLFVSDFGREGMMNEIHWDETGIPLPSNH